MTVSVWRRARRNELPVRTVHHPVAFVRLDAEDNQSLHQRILAELYDINDLLRELNQAERLQAEESDYEEEIRL